jgi:hypothetical protein
VNKIAPGVTDPVNKTVQDTTGTVDNAIGGVTGTVTGVVGKALPPSQPSGSAPSAPLLPKLTP